jgi:hypothetical protein
MVPYPFRITNPGVPPGVKDPGLNKIRHGPNTTRGDMEDLALFLITPPGSRFPNVTRTPLGTQFYQPNVDAVMDTFYWQLQAVIFVPLQDDDSLFLDAYDWQSKLGDAEKNLLESVKRFILHTAIHSANARPSDIAFDRHTDQGDALRHEKVDCLEDYVKDVIALARWLKDSAAVTEGPLPSLKDFVRTRIAKLDTLAQRGRRSLRKSYFAPNSERRTHLYARQTCCVILGLTDDYDQRPIFGLNKWNKDVLMFDNLETLLWKGFGLKLKGDRTELKDMTGSLIDLDAHFISTGPFKFAATTRVQEHLTLDRKNEIRIYVSKSLDLTAFMFQSHVIARYPRKDANN